MRVKILLIWVEFVKWFCILYLFDSFIRCFSVEDLGSFSRCHGAMVWRRKLNINYGPQWIVVMDYWFVWLMFIRLCFWKIFVSWELLGAPAYLQVHPAVFKNTENILMGIFGYKEQISFFIFAVPFFRKITFLSVTCFR